MAPLTGGTEYKFVLPLHIEFAPMIVAGIAGWVEVVISNICGEEVPHVLVAVTEIFPPEELAVAEIVSEEEVPLHPLGNVHV